MPSMSPTRGREYWDLTAVTSGDMLTGSLSIVSGSGVPSTYNFTGQTLAEIAQSFNQPPDEQNDNTGITAALDPTGTILTFTETGGDAGTPSISGVGIKDVTLLRQRIRRSTLGRF